MCSLGGALLVATGSLAACGVGDAPTPNKHLAALAAEAEANAADPAAASLRRGDASELRTEMLRLCGFHSNHDPVASCDAAAIDDAIAQASSTLSPTPNEPGATARTLTVAAQHIVDQAKDIPQESGAVVAQQIVELVQAGAAPPAAPSLGLDDNAASQASKEDRKHDQQAARETLRQLYAMRYAVGVGMAYASNAQAVRGTQDLRALSDRISAVSTALDGTDDVPAPEAAYSLSGDYPQPKAPGSGDALLERIRADEVALWQATAAQAQSGNWRAMSLALGAQAAV